ncbi:hypothetical protein [Actinomycetospora chiangmaiensis]|uniref:hypothetical protein n=1 Tax=Actinomycetospora chiangmaiensis TaxID=402650 RepID=UPI0012FAF662|nr:hypothetical protein [Actinomycetospora chiangmaiensis]
MRVLGRSMLTAAIILCGVVVTGCATGGTAPGPATSASASPTTDTGAPASGTAGSGPSNSGPSSSGVALPTSGAETLDGVATRGALPSCLVLTTADGRHFVLLGAPTTPVGVPITVTGTADPGSASACNAGTPVQVSSVQRR